MTKTNETSDGAGDASGTRSLRELFVLGMLSRRPMYGHEIMRTVSLSNARAWIEISDKHVYHVLPKLERRGQVTAVEEREERRPPRRRFELTPAGRTALATMITNEAHQRAVAYSPFDTVIAMLAWGNSDGDLALELMRARRTVLAQRLSHEHSRSLCPMIEARFGRVPRAMFMKSRMLLAAELRWLDALIQETSRLGWAAMRIRDDPQELTGTAGRSPRPGLPRAPAAEGRVPRRRPGRRA